MKRDQIAALIFVITALISMGVAFLTRTSLPVTREAGKTTGEVVFLIGMLFFIWTVIYLRESFQGTVTPVSDRLVTSGPYRWMRHPLYLSMIITLVGIAIALGSLWGIVVIFALFLPAVVHRARLEEQALAEKFGDTWKDYVHQTNFLIPFAW